jgi:hypothetical protein
MPTNHLGIIVFSPHFWFVCSCGRHLHLEQQELGVAESMAFIALSLASEGTLSDDLSKVVEGNFRPDCRDEMEASKYILLISCDEVVDAFVDEVGS